MPKVGTGYVLIRADHKRKLDSDLRKAEGKLRKSVDRMGATIKRITFAAAAVSVAAFGAALVLAAKHSLSLGRQFEATMKTVQAWSGATGKELQALTKIAREMGATTEHTAVAAAGALKFLAAAGFTAKQSIAALPKTLDLATAGQVDLATSADIATDVLTAFGLQVEELTRVNDAFIVTSSSSNTNVMMLGQSFKMVAPTAKLFGLSIEQTAAFLGTLANAGVKAEMAGSGLNMILLKSARAAKMLGLDAMTPLIEVLIKMKEAQWGAVKIGEAFGARQVKTAAILMDGIGSYEKLTQKILENAGATEKLAAIIRDSLDTDIKTLVSTIQEELLKTYDDYKERLREIVQATTAWIRANADWIRQDIKGYLKIAASAIREVADAVSTLWALFVAPPMAVIQYFKDVAVQAEIAREQVRKLGDEFEKLKPPDKTSFDLFLVFLTAWGEGIVAVIKLAFKALGSAVGLIFNTVITSLKTLAAEFVTLARIAAKALTFDFAGAKRALADFVGETFDLSAEFERNFKVFGKSILKDWDQTLKDLGIRTEAAAEVISRKLFVNRRRRIHAPSVVSTVDVPAPGAGGEIALPSMVSLFERERLAEQQEMANAAVNINAEMYNNMKFETKGYYDFRKSEIEIAHTVAVAMGANQVLAHDNMLKQLKELDAEQAAHSKSLIQDQLDEQARVLKARTDAFKKYLKDQARAEAQRLVDHAKFNKAYENQGKSTFDLERERIKDLATEWEKQGVNKVKLAEFVAKEMDRVDKEEAKKRMQNLMDVNRTMVEGFKFIGEMGAKYSREAFALYKGFKIAETIITTHSGAIKAYESMLGVPYIGVALGIAAAAAVVAFGIAQVAAIAAQQPPSYDSGGISRARGVYQTGNISEAHIPLQGGRVPVNITGGQVAGGPSVVINMENPVFQDLATQRRVFEEMARVIAIKEAPGAVMQNFNDGAGIRDMVYRRPY